MTIDKRRHERLKHAAQLKIITKPEEVYTLEMNDFSESGLYVVTDNTDIVELGDVVEVQTLEIEDAPVLPSKVVRIDKTGFAVEFQLD
jgi:hypothetical protein